MLFNSSIFLLFLVCIYALYWSLSARFKLWLLVLSGCVFYGAWDWRFLILLFFTSGIDYFSAKKIQVKQNAKSAKVWLILSISANLLTLGFFKYFNFFAQSLALLLNYFGIHLSHSLLHIILPVGISFYTFQSIAYVTDVYRGKTKAVNSALHYFAFICFFPQMVAGPIERANHMLPQFERKKKWSLLYFESGINLLAYGFFKKVVIADNLAIITDNLHNNLSAQGSINLLFGIFVFAIQIYADFSGYTDIARGSARLLGYKLRLNFYFPYFSSSFKIFWHRWHISLSTWFRDYLYIPLGGKLGSKARSSFNLVFTFVISGLWHGANFTFLFWGFMHGILLVFERRFNKFKLPKVLSNILVFFFVAYLFTLFRSQSLTHFVDYSFRLFSFQNDEGSDFFNLIESGYYFAIPILAFLFIELRNYHISFYRFRNYNYILNILIFVLILVFSVFENAPSFLYFQF